MAEIDWLCPLVSPEIIIISLELSFKKYDGKICVPLLYTHLNELHFIQIEQHFEYRRH